MTFRLATAADGAAILALYESVKGKGFCVWSEAYPGEEELRRDLATHNVYVLTEGDALVGAISAEPENDMDSFSCWLCNDGTQRELARVVIAAPWQGQGLAARLVTEIAAELKTSGCHTLHLAVATGNLPAYRTYQKLGFCTHLETPLYGGQYYLMEKLLADR